MERERETARPTAAPHPPAGNGRTRRHESAVCGCITAARKRDPRIRSDRANSLDRQQYLRAGVSAGAGDEIHRRHWRFTRLRDNEFQQLGRDRQRRARRQLCVGGDCSRRYIRVGIRLCAAGSQRDQDGDTQGVNEDAHRRRRIVKSLSSTANTLSDTRRRYLMRHEVDVLPLWDDDGATLSPTANSAW